MLTPPAGMATVPSPSRIHEVTASRAARVPRPHDEAVRLTAPARTLLAALAAALAVTAPLVPARAREHDRDRAREERRPRRGRLPQAGEAGDESAEALVAAEQFAQARTAPGVVLPGAYGAAFASLSALPVYGASWTEVTSRPYDLDDPRYRDPLASN